MIETPEQLDAAVSALGNLYHVLASLREKTKTNIRNFALYAEGPMKLINEIQDEIDEYTGRRVAEEQYAQRPIVDSLSSEAASETDTIA